MTSRIASAWRFVSGLAELCMTMFVYAAIFVGLSYASFLVVIRGIEDYGLLAGILVALPFVAVIWIGSLFLAAWLMTAK